MTHKKTDGVPTTNSQQVQSEEALWTEGEALERFRTDCKENLGDALEKLSGKRIADFAWKSEAKKGHVRVSLQKTTRRNKYGSVFLVFQTADKHTAHLEVPWWLTGSNDIVAKFTLPFIGKQFNSTTKISWKMASSDMLSPQGDDSDSTFRLGGTVVLSGRPNPKWAPLGLVWFPKRLDDHYSSVAVRPGIERLTSWTNITKDYWPSYDDSQDSSLAWSMPLPNETIISRQGVKTSWEEWAKAFLSALVWSFLTRFYDNIDNPRHRLKTIWKDEKHIQAWLPPLANYSPRRPIDLNPDEVTKRLKASGLRMPWHVIEAACAALNAGKHVIFSGPPGCGKSKLSIELAKLATSTAPLTGTASPAWTAGDLIGRYMPRMDGKGLEFKPGLFLRAVSRNSKWLLIDEFNRANIDAAFGELFSVLAGDIVELPFEDIVRDDDGSTEHRPVRIVPSQRLQESESNSDSFRDFNVSERFRLLGTMNDADRSRLHQLSFALQRRVANIRVDAPESQVVKELIENKIDEVNTRLGLVARNGRRANTWIITKPAQKAKRPRSGKPRLMLAKEELTYLFAHAKDHQDDFANLVAERLVGVATVLEVIQFVGEGLRTPEPSSVEILDEKGKPREDVSQKDVAEEFVLSYLALAVAIHVFPQLEAIPHGVPLFNMAVKHILDSFAFDIKQRGVDYPKIWQVTTTEQSGSESHQFRLQERGTIRDFLLGELRNRLPDRQSDLDELELEGQ